MADWITIKFIGGPRHQEIQAWQGLPRFFEVLVAPPMPFAPYTPTAVIQELAYTVLHYRRTDNRDQWGRWLYVWGVG